jgi:hypothetical protein
MLSTSNVQAAEYRSSSWSWFLFLWRRQCLRCLAFDYVFVFEFCTIVASTIARGFAPFFYIFISSSYPVFPNKAGISIFLYGNAEHPAPFKLLSKKKGFLQLRGAKHHSTR